MMKYVLWLDMVNILFAVINCVMNVRSYHFCLIFCIRKIDKAIKEIVMKLIHLSSKIKMNVINN